MPLNPLLFYKINEMFPISFSGTGQKSIFLERNQVMANMQDLKYLHFNCNILSILTACFFFFYSSGQKEMSLSIKRQKCMNNSYIISAIH